MPLAPLTSRVPKAFFRQKIYFVIQPPIGAYSASFNDETSMLWKRGKGMSNQLEGSPGTAYQIAIMSRLWQARLLRRV